MLNADILRRLLVISYEFLVLQLFNNRQATLSHVWVEACIKFRPCARLDCNSQPFAIKKSICWYPFTEFKEKRGTNANF